MLIPRNAAPRGLPRWRSLACGESLTRRDAAASKGIWGEEKEVVVVREWGDDDIEVFSRKSCVMAMPILAKDREVRSQARKVRSVLK